MIHPLIDNLRVTDDTFLCGMHHPDQAVVHACKDPCYRGLKGRVVLPKDPEYLAARRGNHLYLNLIDAADPAFIPVALLKQSVAFIRDQIDQDHGVTVHCNRAQSRAPSLALLYLARYTGHLPNSSYQDAKEVFETIYPAYLPGAGISAVLENNWEALLAET